MGRLAKMDIHWELGHALKEILPDGVIVENVDTKEEKKVIFKKFALPKILKRMGMREEEIEITDDGLDEIVELCSSSSGIRDVEQVAEHIAANALYQIEAEGATKPVYDANTVRALIL